MAPKPGRYPINLGRYFFWGLVLECGLFKFKDWLVKLNRRAILD